jgi:hypothetical protein
MNRRKKPTGVLVTAVGGRILVSSFHHDASGRVRKSRIKLKLPGVSHHAFAGRLVKITKRVSVCKSLYADFLDFIF